MRPAPLLSLAGSGTYGGTMAEKKRTKRKMRARGGIGIVAARMKEVRLAAGLTHHDLAVATGLLIATISRAENGHADVTAYSLREWCKACDVLPGYLLDLTDKPHALPKRKHDV